jgi:chloramphenicol 3-O-phosphotransferase
MPYLVWRDTAPTLLPGFIRGIAELAAAGNQVILSTGGWAPDTFRPITERVPTAVVRLDSPLPERQRRQAGRSDRWGGLTEETDSTADGWVHDLTFDTSLLSPDAIADAVLTHVAGVVATGGSDG